MQKPKEFKLSQLCKIMRKEQLVKYAVAKMGSAQKLFGSSKRQMPNGELLVKYVMNT